MKPYLQRTYYELLDVSKNASAEEIRFAYKRAAALPATTCAARYGIVEPAQLNELRKLLLEAVEILSDLDLRAEYDRTIGSSPSEARSLAEGDSAPAQLAMGDILNVKPVQRSAPYLVRAAELSPAPHAERGGGPSAELRTGTGWGAEGAPATTPGVPALRPKPKGIPADAEFNGELLRSIRESRGLTLQQVCEKTRISVRHLENVEADRYDALPTTVYLRGIVMSLARELKLDPLRVARSYLGLVAAAQERQK